MRINTNVGALNAYRNLTETNNAVSSSMQKLSSGFRINKAGDDAAGLGIANRLRADTRSMAQASKNAEQANSVLQIAEGATSSIQKMLERMKELATQAGSDSVDVAGRARINAEFSELKEEITRTVDTTKFQGGHLLQTVAAVSAQPAAETGFANVTGNAAVVGAGTSITAASAAAGEYRVWDDAGTVRLEHRANSSASWTSLDTAVAGETLTAAGIAIELADPATALPDDAASALTFSVTAAVQEAPQSGGDRSFLVGSSEQYTTHDLLTVEGMNLTLSNLGLTSSTVGTAADARTALTAIDTAMGTVATTLGNIGATQNRIEFAQTNLKTTIQNFTAAESVIRDVDMAEEMTKFSKNNILAQAGTAMLAQANQSAQGVLQLLRG